jgi:F-type H+-transporting ATPase subunit delta
MREIALKYADALREYISGEEFKKVVEQLRDFCSLLERDKDLNLFFTARFIPKSEKLKLLDEICKIMDLNEDLRNYLSILVEKNRMGYLPHILRELEEIEAKEEAILVLNMELPYELKIEQRQELEKFLEQKLGKRVKLNTFKMPEMILGFKIYFDHKVLDLSLDEILRQLRKNLLTKL